MAKNTLPTVKVQGGQDYVMVKDRVAEFHRLYKDGSIETEIISNDSNSVIMKATVRPDPSRRFTGHAESYTDARGVEGQKPLEVAETSAIGRALAAMGIGVIESFASADEIQSSNTFGRKWTQKPLSEKQKNLLKISIYQAGFPMPEEEWFQGLDNGTFQKALKKAKDSPQTVKGFPDNLNKGDDPDYHSPEEIDDARAEDRAEKLNG